jgi:predicted MFS family arabinose efflux permease
MSSYWQQASGSPSELLSGLVFAIPGMVALAALYINKRTARQRRRLPDHLILNLLLCTGGMLLQGIEAPQWIIVGRVLFGWAFFQIVVKLDVTMFALSTPTSYASDFSVINFFQNLGVLLASFAAGAVVDEVGLRAPFLIASAGLLLCTLLSIWLVERKPAGPARHDAQTAHPALADAALSNDLANSGVTRHAN